MRLRGLGIYLPSQHHHAADIAAASGVPEAVVREKLGIVKKMVPGADDHTNAMGVRAAQAALEDAGVHAEEIDVLIGITEEYKEYPVWTAAIQTAHALGAHKAWAYDLGQKCGTAILALKQAKDLLLADPSVQHVLIAGGYRNGDLVDYRDPATRFLNNLAAGGGAAVVSREGRGFELLGSAMRTDGSFSEDVIVPVGGTRAPLNAMNLQHFRFQIPDQPGMRARLEEKSLANFTGVIEDACARSGFAAREAAYVALLHMKRSAHLEVLQRIGVAPERSIYLEDYGHVGQIDPLLSLQLARDSGRLKSGDCVVLCAAGIGYVWNALCLRCP
jgi:3-oxoacyl-[acyl-carrier-protein] synthase-3